VSNRPLLAILVSYTLLATTYSLVSPLFEVSDELWHYPMVKFIADNADLPVQDPANPGPWRQEGSQPPLYYMMGAALTFWIDTSDMNLVRQPNPHADIGAVRPDGNANMMVHRDSLQAFPWTGTALAVHIVRFMSVTLGLGTVYVTYLLGRELFPDWDAVALVAAALVAFLPMFVFIHGSVNNDALSNLLGNLIILLLVRLLLRDDPPNIRNYVVLGLAVGAGLLAKGSIGFLVFVVAFVLAVLSFRHRSIRPFFVGGLVSGGITNLIAAWWYIRNWVIYGDPTGLNTFLDTVGRRLIPANAGQLWAERNSFLQAYWGFFGGVNVPLTGMVYVGFNLIGGLALLSGIIYLLVTAVRRTQNSRWWLAAFVTFIWIIVTFVSYLRWTSITPASQGRLVFVALSSISLWMAVGLLWPLRGQTIGTLLAGSAVAYFAIVAVTAPFLVIRPMYTPPPPPFTINNALTTFVPAPDNAPGQVAYLGGEVSSDVVQPGDYVHLQTNWQVDAPLDRNWSLFVHLTTPDGVIIGQRDVYPGRGLLATSQLSEDHAWQNPIAVKVPDAAYAPSTLEVLVGWYHLPTGERMTTANGEERINVGTVELQPRDADHDLPNPVRINFDNQIALLGYEYSTLTPAQGEEMTVTLHWQAIRPIAQDYVIFVHIIDATTFEIVGGSDAQPVGWTRPTSTWEPGEIVEDAHTFTVREDARPIPYELEIGMYTVEQDSSFLRLRVIDAFGGMADNFYYLSRVRVEPSKNAE
jgi:4-amino-4-deoxy-L-arabinose transferase-like glycosyltransferase